MELWQAFSSKFFDKPHGPNCCHCIETIEPAVRVAPVAKSSQLYPAVYRECCKCGLTKRGFRLPFGV